MKGSNRYPPSQAAEELLRDPEIQRDWTARFACGEQQIKKEFGVYTRDKKSLTKDAAKVAHSAGKSRGATTTTTTTASAHDLHHVEPEARLAVNIASSLGLMGVVVGLEDIPLREDDDDQ